VRHRLAAQRQLLVIDGQYTAVVDRNQAAVAAGATTTAIAFFIDPGIAAKTADALREDGAAAIGGDVSLVIDIGFTGIAGTAAGTAVFAAGIGIATCTTNATT